MEKEIRWIGSSSVDILDFPLEARKEAGFQIGKVQAGLDPDDWKSFGKVGSGSREIRIRDASGIYRVMYVGQIRRSHLCAPLFPKETESTTKHVKDIVEARYKAVARERGEPK
jgi:phage-related protein